MLNITSKQWFQIFTSVNSGLITSAALMQTLFGQDLTLKIVAVLGILNIIVGAVGASLSGQAGLVRDVRAMDGVQNIEVNAKANPTLAQMAVDSSEAKISITPGAQAQVVATARAAS